MERVNPLDWFMVLLVLLGGGSWLAAGLFQLNLVKLVTFNVEWLARAFYVAVGIAAHYMVYMAYKLNRS
jgi:uncharacterized membrane protein YuzA (DUF378 family)